MKTFLVMVNGAQHSHCLGHYDVEDDITDEAASQAIIEQQAPHQKEHCTVHRCEIPAGHYRPRMARSKVSACVGIGIAPIGPLYSYSENLDEPLPHDPVILSTSLNQLSVLTKELTEVMRYIEPAPANMQAYGQLTRSALIIASMEVENEFRGILAANKYIPPSSRLSTKDFVKLHAPLRLDEYSVSFPFYPQVGQRQPFQSWQAINPTASLPWYDAYNAVKHDRSANFARATLDNALDSVIAFAILLAAQYRLIPVWRDQIGDFFKFDQAPQWRDWDKYAKVEAGWTEQPYIFP